MFTLTAFMTVVYWALIAWIIQDTFERENDALTMPKPEYVDLEWLDHRSAEIEKRTVVAWHEVPLFIKAVFSIGMLGELCVGQTFYWVPTYCFGSFEVTDDINTLSLFGTNSSLILLTGLCGLIVSCVCCGGWLILSKWAAIKTKPAVLRACAELDLLEEEWKKKTASRSAQSTGHWRRPRAYTRAGKNPRSHNM